MGKPRPRNWPERHPNRGCLVIAVLAMVGTMTSGGTLWWWPA